jgi:hypothetical protein
MTIQLADVMRSLGQHMENLGVAVYNSDYTETDLPAVVFGELADEPANAVAINYYNTNPDIFTVATTPLIRVQLAWRAKSESPLAALSMAENGFRKLHTMTPGPWPGGVHPVWMLRTITNNPDRDDNDRWIQADSYDIQLNPGE